MAPEPIDQREFWDRRAAAWDRRAAVLGEFSASFGGPAMSALAVMPGESLLDIGCGPGTTTLELAELTGPSGRATGVDISPGMIEAATRRGAGAPNVEFRVADVQSGELGGPHDAVYSRFGVMFFTDPAAAFANIERALRPGGRLAFAVWSDLGDNPWLFVPRLAAGDLLHAPLELPGPGEPGPFSLADVAATTALLEGAGLTDVTIERVEGALVIAEAAADEEVRAMLGTGPLAEAFEAADENTRAAAVAAVLDACAPYRSDDGWRLPGASLTITARR